MNKTPAFAFFVWMLALFLIPGAVAGQPAQDSLYRATLAQAMQKVAENSYPSAIFNLKKCIEMAPQDAVPYYQLANVYAQLDDANMAVYYARKAFTLEPANLWYEEYLLTVAVKYRRMEAVQAVLERRFERDDRYLGDLLDTYAFTQSWDKSLSAINTYEKKHGRSEKTIGYRKDIYLKSKDYKNAQAQLKALQKISPDKSQYAVQRAMIMGLTGQKEESWKYLEDFYRKHPGDGYLAYTMLPHYNEVKDYDKMFEAMLVVAKDTSFSVQDRMKVLDMTAMIAMKEQKYLPEFEKALETILSSSNDPVVYAYGSEYYYSQKDEERGFDLLRKAVRGGFSDQGAVMRLLYTEAQGGNFQNLSEDARLVLDSIGEAPEVYYLYGYAENSLGRPQAAIPALERGKQLAREGAVQLYVEICSMLGSLYNESGDADKSAENFELVLLIDPENAGALNNYGYFMACRGQDLPRARTMLEKAVKIKPDEPAFLDSYAWILYLQKDYKGALVKIEESLALDKDPSAEVLEHYYKILTANGETQQAEAARKRFEDKKKAEESEAVKMKAQSAE